MSCFMFSPSHTKTQHTFNTTQLYGCFALIFVVPGLFAHQVSFINRTHLKMTHTHQSTVENDEDIENANHSKYKDKIATGDQ